MSHFTQVATQFKSKKGLVDALVACGIPREHIEVHNEPVLLKDYCNHTTKYRYADTKDERFKDGDACNVIIRRKHLGAMNNDFGVWIDESSGESIAFLCDYSRHSTQFNDQWLAGVRAQYAVSEIEAEHADKCEETTKVEADGKIFIYAKAGG